MKKKEFIINDLLSKIYQDYYSDGKLPTQRQLAEFYEVSRYTIQAVIAKLRDIGVINVIQGSGIFVRQNMSQNPLIYNSITATPYSRILSKPIYLKKEVATEADRRMFEIEKEDEIWEFQRIRIVNYQIVQIENSRLPYKLFPNLEKEDISNSIQEYVQCKGYKISHYITSYTPILINKEQSQLMACKKGLPAMKIQNRCLLRDGTVYEYSEVIALDYSCTYITPFNKQNHLQRKQKK
ncbi:HTH-type transcriptional repressor GamR [Paraliobacillus ryukyuensis]|uniref:DNA-binding GntR family transcriptional regulator n=1 Tax=Paraliobacillus ryukyuensis TaxID=200904 RepID=A0A366EBQ6_9BACI|nr:GntR family transcriptional regulator [Paraliobacillus ryukyuensis]RBO99850.1 DNA-binding GntR family transcriptional regulator [Paraliobacillus ryukyuensis]